MSSKRKRLSRYKRAGIILVVGAICAWIVSTIFGYLNVREAFPGNILQILQDADEFELLALSPMRVEIERLRSAIPDVPDTDTVDRHRVIGSVSIRNAAVRQRLISELVSAMKHGERWPSLCFDPRHGIRARLSGETVEVAICFECRQVHVHTKSGNFSGTVSTRAEGYFNEVLRAAGVEPDYGKSAATSVPSTMRGD